MTQRSIGFGALLSATLWIASPSILRAQSLEPYSQNERAPRPLAGGMPAEHYQGRRLYVAKCATCHSLSRAEKKTDLSAEEWGDIVDRMRNRAASHMNDAQAKAILDYLVWDGEQKKKRDESK